ncbi:MAG: Asp-tRNA(Asn)/Glu-tRNA(Gln) amidotransferase GatCAB subunit B, partial [Planctomycetota bacterium]
APKATRGFDLDRGVTYPMREKEEAADYRYFPDPDLTPVTITDAEVETIRSTMGEFPADRRSRFVAALELSAYDAGVIIDQGVAFADYFEEVHRACGDPKRAANWCTQDVLRDMNERGEGLVAFSAAVPASVLGGLLRLIGDGDLTTAAARDEYAKYLGGDYETAGGTTPEDALADVRANAEAAGALTVKDTGALQAAIATVLDKPSSDKAIEAVKGGKQQAVGPLIGQVMKEVKGADPKTVREMLIAAIEAR